MAKGRNSTTASIPSCLLIISLLLLSFLISCVLTPFVDLGVGKLFSKNFATTTILVSTAMLVFLALCIVLCNSLKSDVRQSLNLSFYSVIFHFLLGLVIAFAVISLVAGIVWALRFKKVYLDFWDGLWSYVFLAFWTGLVTETVHRGFIFQSLSAEIRVFPAMVFSSAFFSLIQFMYSQSATLASNSFDLFSGFKAFPRLFDAFRSFPEILPNAIGYFLLGILFCLMYVKMKSLYVSIAAYALFVFVDQSRCVTIGKKLLVGRKLIVGSEGPFLGAFIGSIMLWVFLLIAIGVLLFGVKSSKT